MNIYIEQNAELVADLGNQSRPACDGIIMKLGDPRDVLAVTLCSNPLSGDWLLDLDLPSDCIVTWSGTLADSLFEAHPMTWMKPGHDALSTFCDQIAPQLLEHGRRVCFQPHARHVLSDAQSCLHFARERSQQPFDIAFSPASVLERDMLDDLGDHLMRGFEAVSMLGASNAMVMLHDVPRPKKEANVSEAAALRHLPLGDGILPRNLVLRLLERYVAAETPVVLRPERIDQQLEWLGL